MKNKYYITLGLEIHAELTTQSKMFCGCPNVPLEKKPNQNVCPICLAHPGTLPTLNQEAIQKMIRLGLYLGAEIADFTEWDRKHYFYPDLPKAYQLTQYKYPIVRGGKINNWPLTRIHLEEDTAKSTHDQGNNTLIDFNRSGLPLAELVTEPKTFAEIELAAKTSSNFAKEYGMILKILGAGEAEMSKGQMRIEVNLSVSKDKNKYGTKVEIKNINSFKSIEDAIRYEATRQIALLEAKKGSEIIQETRGFEENQRITVPQRTKENANDYRYFPDPDLPKLYLHSLFNLESLKNSLPESLDKIRIDLKALSIQENYVEILLYDSKLFRYFNQIKNEIEKYHDFTSQTYKALITLAVNYICVDISGILQRENKEKEGGELLHFINPDNFLGILEMIHGNELSSRGAKDLIFYLMSQVTEIAEENTSVREMAEKRGLIQKNDRSVLEEIIDEVIESHHHQFAELKRKWAKGDQKLIMFFVGQAMKRSAGSGNPQIFLEIMKERLK